MTSKSDVVENVDMNRQSVGFFVEPDRGVCTLFRLSTIFLLLTYLREVLNGDDNESICSECVKISWCLAHNMLVRACVLGKSTYIRSFILCGFALLKIIHVTEQFVPFWKGGIPR